MSINQAALSADGTAIILLPNEKVFLEKTGVCLESVYGNGFPGSSGCYNAASGHVYLSNQRIVYLAQPSLVGFQSLSMPLLNIHEGKLNQPWFNANYYSCTVEPVYQGGLPAAMQVKLYFKEGGAFEFSTIYRQLRERIQELGELPDTLEQLPAYTPRAEGIAANASTSTAAPTNHPIPGINGNRNSMTGNSSAIATEHIASSTPLSVAGPPPSHTVPQEAPPDYDTAIQHPMPPSS